MPVALQDLVEPRNTALLVMECQQAVIGALAGASPLAEAVARHGTISRIAGLCDAARSIGVPVVYLNASRRADRRGSKENCLLLAASRRSEPLVPGSPRQAVVDELAPQPDDFIFTRMHGVTPFHGTELDVVLRNLGVRNVVATGVSLNVGITGLTIEAVNSGYQVILPRDCVAGVPDAYADAVLEHTLRLLATITTSDEIAAIWHSTV